MAINFTKIGPWQNDIPSPPIGAIELNGLETNIDNLGLAIQADYVGLLSGKQASNTNLTTISTMDPLTATAIKNASGTGRSVLTTTDGTSLRGLAGAQALNSNLTTITTMDPLTATAIQGASATGRSVLTTTDGTTLRGLAGAAATTDLAIIVKRTSGAATVTMLSTDGGKVIHLTSASAQTVQIPLEATINFAEGTWYEFFMAGTSGTMPTVTGETSGVTFQTPLSTSALTSFTISVKYGTVQLRKPTAGSNIWIASGNIAP